MKKIFLKPSFLIPSQRMIILLMNKIFLNNLQNKKNYLFENFYNSKYHLKLRLMQLQSQYCKSQLAISLVSKQIVE